MWPDELKCFISYCYLFKDAKIQKDNFLLLFRDYFLLDLANFHNNNRDNKLFNKIRKKMEQIYPIFKNQYGKNRYLEKLLSYVEENNDNFKNTKKILDNIISVKQKED